MRTFATDATRATNKTLSAMLPAGAEDGRLIVVGAFTVDDAVVIGRDQGVSAVLLSALHAVTRGDVAATAAEQLNTFKSIPDMSRVFVTYTTMSDQTGRTGHHLINLTLNRGPVAVAVAYRTGPDGPLMVEMTHQPDPDPEFATDGVEARAASTASYLARGRDRRIDSELADILGDLKHAIQKMPHLRTHSDPMLRKGRQSDKLLDLSARLARAAGDAAVVEGLLDAGGEV
jgi:hypothetical protein